jgi:hypothetical protein
MLRRTVWFFDPVRHTLKSILEDVETAIKDRIPVRDIVQKLSRMHSSVSDNLGNDSDHIQLAFTCARLSKLGNIKTRELGILRDIVEGTVLEVDLSTLDIMRMSRFLWACAVLNVKPLLPAGVFNTKTISEADSKDYCNIVWALSKFASVRDPVILYEFDQIVDSLDQNRVADLSNDDIVALLRSISKVYSK